MVTYHEHKVSDLVSVEDKPEDIFDLIIAIEEMSLFHDPHKSSNLIGLEQVSPSWDLLPKSQTRLGESDFTSGVQSQTHLLVIV